MKLPARLCVVSMIFLAACASRETVQNTSIDSVAVDTARLVINNEIQIVPLDSTVYVGAAEYFSNTREFYIPLYYRQEGDNYVDPEQLDSVVYKSDEVKRSRLPMKEAAREFYLEELDHVLIYNSNNHLVGRFKLSRVEYVENEISAEFVAVFPAQGAVVNADEQFFAVSANYTPMIPEDFRVHEMENQDWTDSLMRDLNLDKRAKWVVNHYVVFPEGIIYSTVSTDTSSYLVETNESQSTVVQEGIDFHFGKIMPLPLLTYGRPLIVVYFYIPEGDMTGTFLSSFNGTTYEGASYNRIDLKVLNNRSY